MTSELDGLSGGSNYSNRNGNGNGRRSSICWHIQKKLMEYDGGSIAIHPKFDKLITSLRTAVEKGDGSLDKEATSYDDTLDGFRLTLQFYD